MGGRVRKRSLSPGAWCMNLLLILLCLLSVAGILGAWESKTVVSFSAGNPGRQNCETWDLEASLPDGTGTPRHSHGWEDLTVFPLADRPAPGVREADT